MRLSDVNIIIIKELNLVAITVVIEDIVLKINAVHKIKDDEKLMIVSISFINMFYLLDNMYL